jgi:hypothetical protein
MIIRTMMFAASALALAACSAKAPAVHAARPPASTNPPQAEAATQKADNGIAAYATAKVAAADFIIAHPNASDAEAVAAAAVAALHAGDPAAKTTADYAASDAKDWVATRKANGFPPLSTPAELASNDAVADAASRRSLAEMSEADRKALGGVTTEPEEPSKSPHYFPKIGTCFETQVASIASRLENAPDSGSAVSYTDGHYQVAYETSPAVQAFRVGDPVRLCVIDLPGHCPPADDRGINFLAVNGRTGDRWEAGDSEHKCGGA